ncbi:MAG: TIGR00730 family Rossman fold protein [Phycisphaerales bacterium]|nr:TIGR00730 family Rossman fold protein [Phycisphaerales bacterium]MDP6693659.1 TIGR00730 family Rossman fold protein [Phycisphaerales bacterium]
MNSLTVYCASSTQLEPAFHEAADRVGSGLASRGLSLVYGGGCIGLMGEVASSAAKGGAIVTGIITHKFVSHEQANNECDELIVVDTMQERRTIMMEKGDGYLVLPGGVGTYEEFFEVLVGRQIGDHTKPIGIVNINGYFDPLSDMLEHGIEHHFIRKALRQLVFINSCPDAVLDHLVSHEVVELHPNEILPMHGGNEG